jgi:heme O synthase-like polyprenyltransferase
MTEYEILDLQATYVAALGTDIMNFISIMSGYLLASYFLGAKLRLSQFIVLTLTYSIIMLVVMASIMTNYGEIQAAESVLRNMERTWVTQKVFSSEALKYTVLCAQFVVFLGSIYFAIMSRVRND